MPNRIDPAVHKVENAPLKAPLNCPRAKPRSQQLTTRDHSVLPLSQFGTNPIKPTSAPFSPYEGVNGARVLHRGRW
jgi:hypothetical protein